MRYWAFVLPLLLSVFVNAQTRTTVQNGETLVVAVTNVNGNPVTTTATLRTVDRAVATTGPIAGAPPDTNQPAAPTTYWQTTFDGNGEAIGTATFVFTPSFAPSSSRITTYPAGTIYNYDSWTAQYATATFIPNGAAPLLDKGVTTSFMALAGSLVASMLFVLL